MTGRQVRGSARFSDISSIFFQFFAACSMAGRSVVLEFCDTLNCFGAAGGWTDTQAAAPARAGRGRSRDWAWGQRRPSRARIAPDLRARQQRDFFSSLARPSVRPLFVRRRRRAGRNEQYNASANCGCGGRCRRRRHRTADAQNGSQGASLSLSKWAA